MKIENKVLEEVSNLDLGDNVCFVIPEGIREIDVFAFYECSNLEEVRIPNGVTEIGNGAFDRCSNLHQIMWKGEALNI